MRGVFFIVFVRIKWFLVCVSEVAPNLVKVNDRFGSGCRFEKRQPQNVQLSHTWARQHGQAFVTFVVHGLYRKKVIVFGVGQC